MFVLSLSWQIIVFQHCENSNQQRFSAGLPKNNTPGKDDPYGVWHPGFTSIRLAQTAALSDIDRRCVCCNVLMKLTIYHDRLRSVFKEC